MKRRQRRQRRIGDGTGASGEHPECVRAVQLASYVPAERDILFELDVESAGSTVYTDEGQYLSFLERAT